MLTFNVGKWAKFQANANYLIASFNLRVFICIVGLHIYFRIQRISINADRHGFVYFYLQMKPNVIFSIQIVPNSIEIRRLRNQFSAINEPEFINSFSEVHLIKEALKVLVIINAEMWLFNEDYGMVGIIFYFLLRLFWIWIVNYGQFQSFIGHLLTPFHDALSLTDSLCYSLPFICTCRFGSQVFWSESFDIETETLRIETKKVVFN